MRLPELDGLRGVAILMVIGFHYLTVCLRFDSKPLYCFAWFFQIGWTGVDLFFVLSGFLIGGILFDHRNAKNVMKVFYLRRACRILPLYLVTLGLYIGGVYLF